jgi:hypothetical protein
MKKIIAKTKKAYDAKLEETDKLFKKLNPKFRREFLGGGLEPTKGIYRFPSEYPKGVALVLKKECPYCLKQKEYYRKSWELDTGTGIVHISWDFKALAALEEFKRLNPDICGDCISVHYDRKDNHSPGASNNRKADEGGFWENLFS